MPTEWDINKLKMLFGGLVLIIVAVGFLIFRSRVASTSIPNSSSNVVQVPAVVQMTITPTVSLPPAAARAASKAAVLGLNNGANSKPTTTKGGQALPATGAPEVLIGFLALSAVVAGFSLHKFPR